MLLSTDVNECVQGTHDCEGTCTNTAGGFECGCPQGYQLSSDGRSCIDIDECANDRGGCGQVCSNTPGTFSCGCSEGYKLQPDGFACLRTSYIEKATLAMSRVLISTICIYAAVDQCEEGTHDCAGFCRNAGSSFICDCSPGFDLASNGRDCIGEEAYTLAHQSSHAYSIVEYNNMLVPSLEPH